MRNTSYNPEGTSVVMCPKSVQDRNVVLQPCRFIVVIIIVVPLKTNTRLSCTTFSSVHKSYPGKVIKSNA